VRKKRTKIEKWSAKGGEGSYSHIVRRGHRSKGGDKLGGGKTFSVEKG